MDLESLGGFGRDAAQLTGVRDGVGVGLEATNQESETMIHFKDDGRNEELRDSEGLQELEEARKELLP